MESRFRAGDRRPHRASSSASGHSPSARFPHPRDGSFAAPGMRAGTFPLPPPPPPMPFEWEAARRERFIREEVERRLIEAEVRRELDANCNLPFVGGFGPNPFMPPPPMPMPMPMPMPIGESGAWQQGLGQFRPRRQVKFGQRMTLPGEERRLPPLPAKPKHKQELRGIHPCRSSKALSSEKNVSRPKRKAISVTVPSEPRICSKQRITEPSVGSKQKTTEPRVYSKQRTIEPTVGSKRKTTEPRKEQKLAKDWSCALCQVSATSEAGLNGHLEGKKHKLKLAQCGAIKVITDDKSSLQDTTGNNNGTCPSDAPKKIVIVVDGAMHEVLQKSNYLWCERCKIRCDSNVNMAGHLRGKKHSELNKVWTSLKAARMNTKTQEGLACNHESKVNKNGSTEIPAAIKDDVDVAIKVDGNDPTENTEEIKKEDMFMATEVHENICMETPVEIRKEGADMSDRNDVTQPLPNE